MAAGGQKDERDFYKALCTIRGTDGKTKGITCVVDIGGKKNKNEVVLVTWKGCNGEGKNSVQTVHRYSRNKKNPKDYQLEPSDGSILNRGHFSLIRCACSNDKWGVRLSPKYLKEEEQKADFLVYTVDPDCYRSLTLKYHESTNEHRCDIREEEEHIYANLILRGAPIIQGEKYFVGVLTEDEEGKVSPLFITEGVFEKSEALGHDTVDAQNKPTENQRKKLSFKVTKIPYNVLSEVCKMMNIKDYLNYKDFRGLAEKIGLGRNDAELFDQRSKNPTEEILKEWARKSYEEATVGKLIELLKEMERMDAVKELEDWVNKESS